MSSSKVSTSGQASSTTSIARLAATQAAMLSSTSSAISSVNVSSGVTASTEQSLLSGKEFFQENDSPREEQEEREVVPYSSLESDIAPGLSIRLQEDMPEFYSSHEVERQVEMYEETLKQSEDVPKKRTQSFG